MGVGEPFNTLEFNNDLVFDDEVCPKSSSNLIPRYSTVTGPCRSTCKPCRRSSCTRMTAARGPAHDAVKLPRQRGASQSRFLSLSAFPFASLRESGRAETDHPITIPGFRTYSLHKSYCILRLAIFGIQISATNFAGEPFYLDRASITEENALCFRVVTSRYRALM